jgi:undecaprenyl-phosphate galactose phosphotransferase
MVAGVSLGVLFPLFCVIAALIKLDSRGPIFYAEARLGRGGRLFRCFKFRTMVMNGDEILHELFRANPAAKAEWREYRKLRTSDPRVTRVGRVLRRFSLDEFPQILNILRGEMSVVGPRPFLPRELPDMGEAAGPILTLRPGMAGMWIAAGRNALTFAQRLELELAYVSGWSLRLDLRLFLRCFGVGIRGKGAY